MATPESNKKTRAKHACRSCNSRRVKCNVIERQPCSNCSTTGAKCEILPSRRGRYPRRSQRLQPQMATDDAGISLNPRLKTDMDQGTPSSAKENPFTRADDLCGGRDSATDGIARPLQRIAPAPPSPPPDQPPSDPPLASASASVSASAPLGHPNKPSPTSPASGTLFFGESNFLTLVPSEEAAAAAAAGHSFSQKPRLTFPIPGSPSSSTYADGRGISASTMRYLRDEGALTLPDLRTCLPALQAYFTWFHPSFPVVDRAEITRRLAAMNISPFLLQAMLFIGATYCGDDTIVAMGFRDRAEAKRLLYTRARLLFHADWEKDEMILIQSIFLMSFWRGGPADVRDVRYWLGVVVTLSESYGLHRSPKSSMSKDAHATRMRRRIWWSIYVRERQVAAALGLPSRVRDEDCDMDPLDVGDLESETDGPSSGLFGTCQAEHITYAIKMVEMARLRTNEPPCHPPSPRVLCQPASSTVADVGGLDHALESWKKSLPNGMKCATDEGSESVWTCLLHLAYNHLRILLHLNSFLRSGDGTGEDDKHNQVVTTAACRIGRIAEDMYTHGTLRYGQMHLITSLFAALCIHTICIRRGTGVARCIAEHRARMCLLCLREIQKYWRINNNVLDLFLRYLDRSIAERLDASSHAGTGGHDVDATVNNGAAKSDAAPPARVGAGVQVGVSDAGHALPPSSPTLGQSHSRDGLFEDPYFTLVNGHWEGDDALGDLSLFLQADAFSSPEKGLGLSDRAL